MPLDTCKESTRSLRLKGHEGTYEKNETIQSLVLSDLDMTS